MEQINIYYFTPFSLEKKLGKAYNDYIKLVPKDNDWICLLDADTCFLTPNYGKQIHDIVQKNQHIGMFTCVTNRVFNKQQCYENYISENDSMRNHRTIAQYIQDNWYDEIKILPRDISGFLMLFQKGTWKDVKGFSEEGVLGIDTDFSFKILNSGRKIALMKGVYIFHYYRLVEGIEYKDHLV